MFPFDDVIMGFDSSVSLWGNDRRHWNRFTYVCSTVRNVLSDLIHDVTIIVQDEICSHIRILQILHIQDTTKMLLHTSLVDEKANRTRFDIVLYDSVML